MGRTTDKSPEVRRLDVLAEQLIKGGQIRAAFQAKLGSLELQLCQARIAQLTCLNDERTYQTRVQAVRLAITYPGCKPSQYRTYFHNLTTYLKLEAQSGKLAARWRAQVATLSRRRNKLAMRIGILPTLTFNIPELTNR